MRISPENIVKVTLIAIIGTAVVRMIAARTGNAGLGALVG